MPPPSSEGGNESAQHICHGARFLKALIPSVTASRDSSPWVRCKPAGGQRKTPVSEKSEISGFWTAQGRALRTQQGVRPLHIRARGILPRCNTGLLTCVPGTPPRPHPTFSQDFLLQWRAFAHAADGRFGTDSRAQHRSCRHDCLLPAAPALQRALRSGLYYGISQYLFEQRPLFSVYGEQTGRPVWPV